PYVANTDMPCRATPRRSAQDRMSAVGSAFSSGMPQPSRMALICARCVAYDAGMTVSFRRARSLARSEHSGKCARGRRRVMDGAELLRARFGIDLPGVEVPAE